MKRNKDQISIMVETRIGTLATNKIFMQRARTGYLIPFCDAGDWDLNRGWGKIFPHGGKEPHSHCGSRDRDRVPNPHYGAGDGDLDGG